MKAKLKEEKGMALIISILLLLVSTFIGISAVSTANYDIQISSNKRVAEQAFYVAEAGINEFFGRFRDDAGSPITDASPSNINWRLFLASKAGGAGRIGYSSTDANHAFAQSLQNQLDFAAEVRHKVIANNVVFYGGAPVYIVRSHGFTPEGGSKVIEAEMLRAPNLDPKAPLYSERPVNVLGSSTYVQGMDQCGDPPKNKHGIAVTLPETDHPVTISGNPIIDGTGGNPSIEYNTPNADLRGMIDFLKSSADYSYSYSGNQTLSGVGGTAGVDPYPWGAPTSSKSETPIIYDGPMNVVYVDMQGDKTLKLSGGSRGAGILLVNGNLELSGAFAWYGLIIVSGSLDFSGGGQKNVTGGIYAGETATVQIDVGGNVGIIYCGKVGDKLKHQVSPFRITRWREVSSS